MSQSIEERIADIHRIAAEIGKSPESVFTSIAPTLNIDAFTRAQLEAELARRAPPTKAELDAQHAARVEADRRVHDARVIEIADAREYRRIRSQNPIAGAEYARARGVHVYKDPGDDPPSAA